MLRFDVSGGEGAHPLGDNERSELQAMYQRATEAATKQDRVVVTDNHRSVVAVLRNIANRASKGLGL